MTVPPLERAGDPRPRGTRRGMTAWLGGRLAHPRVPLLAALIALAVAAPGVRVGLWLDDFQHGLALRGDRRYSGRSPSVADLYNFADGRAGSNREKMATGLFPWWTDPRFKLRFFRPVSGFLRWIDFRALGENPVLMHLHNALWFAAAALAAGRFYRRLLDPAWAAGLAVLLFAMNEILAAVTYWVAARNHLVAATFALLAVAAHDRWRRERAPRLAVLPPALLLLALLSCEAAVATGAFLLAYAAFLDFAPRRDRVLSLVPCGLTGLAWFVLYRGAGLGTAASAQYLDPSNGVADFALGILQRFPVYLSAAFGFGTILLGGIGAEHSRAATLAACAALAATVPLFWPVCRRDARGRFWVAATWFAVVPSCTTLTEGALTFPVIGAIGALSRYAALLAEPPAGLRERVLFLRLNRLFAAVLLLRFSAQSLAGIPLRAQAARVEAEASERSARDGAFRNADLAGRDVCVITTPCCLRAWNLQVIRAYRGLPLPRTVRVLSPGWQDVELARSGERGLAAAFGGDLLASPSASFFRRAQAAFREGDAIELPGFRAEIRSVDARGRPREVLFRFDRPLEDPSLLWVYWDGDGFRRTTPPAPGETRRFPRTCYWNSYLPRGTALRALLYDLPMRIRDRAERVLGRSPGTEDGR